MRVPPSVDAPERLKRPLVAPPRKKLSVPPVMLRLPRVRVP